MIDRLGQDWPWVFAGMGAGLASIWTLKVTLDLVTSRARATGWILFGLGGVFRLGLMLAVLFFAVRQSVAAALLAFAGFMLVRWPVLLWLHKRAGRS